MSQPTPPATPTPQVEKPKSDDDPLNILKQRYAKGEITKAEYQEMKKVLESS